MLFCFSSSSSPFLCNLQPPLNGNGKFGKWREEREGAGLNLTSPIWTGEGRGGLASLQATSNPSQLLAFQGRGFSPQMCVFGGLEKAFFFINNCHILHQLLTPRLLFLSTTGGAGGGNVFYLGDLLQGAEPHRC